MATQQDLIDQSRLNAAVEAEEFNLFALLKPRLFRDGDHWCVLYGENIMDGVSGFGETPYKAMLAWRNDWNHNISTEARDFMKGDGDE